MKRLISMTALMAVTATAAHAERSDERVKELVGEYLKEHPEAIIDSLQSYQLKQEAARAKEQQDAIKKVLPSFTKDDSPYGEAGNPEGDVLIVEFFDYNCPACKMQFESIDGLLLTDKKARIVFVEYPIFGEQSDINAKISMAVHNLAPSKYYKFHKAMMRKKGKINEEVAITIASNLGISKTKLKKEIAKPEYDDYILRDRKLAAELQISGTPAMIVGGKFTGGALNIRQLKEQISWARAGEKESVEKK